VRLVGRDHQHGSGSGGQRHHRTTTEEQPRDVGAIVEAHRGDLPDAGRDVHPVGDVEVLGQPCR
jgi:hypothetical protein